MFVSRPNGLRHVARVGKASAYEGEDQRDPDSQAERTCEARRERDRSGVCEGDEDATEAGTDADAELVHQDRRGELGGLAAFGRLTHDREGDRRPHDPHADAPDRPAHVRHHDRDVQESDR
jgi:hypothetical protein